MYATEILCVRKCTESLTSAYDTAVCIDRVAHSAGLEVHGDVHWLEQKVCGQPTAGWPLCL